MIPDSMPLRVGVYICHCGVNIAGKVDVADVSEWAGSLPHVVISRNYKFMCSEPGQAMIETDIRDHGLNRVVVASCSPRLHGKTFMETCRRPGSILIILIWRRSGNRCPG